MISFDTKTPEEQKKYDDFALAYAFLLGAKTTELVRFGKYYVTNRGDIFSVTKNYFNTNTFAAEILVKADEYRELDSYNYFDQNHQAFPHVTDYDLDDARCLSWKRAENTNKNNEVYCAELERRYEFKKPCGILIVPITFLPDLVNAHGERPSIVICDGTTTYYPVEDEYQEVKYIDGLIVYIKTYRHYIKAFGYCATGGVNILEQWQSFVHALELLDQGIFSSFPLIEDFVRHFTEDDRTTFRSADELVSKKFISAIYDSAEATSELRNIIRKDIKVRVAGRGETNSENWTWAHVRRAMCRMGFFGAKDNSKSQEYWEDHCLSDTEFGKAIASCDNTINFSMVKESCKRNKTKPHDQTNENIVNRICEYLMTMRRFLIR